MPCGESPSHHLAAFLIREGGEKKTVGGNNSKDQRKDNMTLCYPVSLSSSLIKGKNALFKLKPIVQKHAEPWHLSNKELFCSLLAGEKKRLNSIPMFHILQVPGKSSAEILLCVLCLSIVFTCSCVFFQKCAWVKNAFKNIFCQLMQNSINISHLSVLCRILKKECCAQTVDAYFFYW